MNKTRILGLLIFALGLFLLYIDRPNDSGWLTSAVIGAFIGLSFMLTTFGRFRFKP